MQEAKQAATGAKDVQPTVAPYMRQNKWKQWHIDSSTEKVSVKGKRSRKTLIPAY